MSLLIRLPHRKFLGGGALGALADGLALILVFELVSVVLGVLVAEDGVALGWLGLGWLVVGMGLLLGLISRLAGSIRVLRNLFSENLS